MEPFWMLSTVRDSQFKLSRGAVVVMLAVGIAVVILVAKKFGSF